jgi:hypothetical protein
MKSKLTTWHFGSLSLLVLAGACSSRNKAVDQDTRLDKSSSAGNQTVGLKDGNVMVQRKVLLAEELRKLEHQTYLMEDEVYGNEQYGTAGMVGVLKDCYKRLSDPRLGGVGKLKRAPNVERVTAEEEKVKYVIDEKGDLVGLSEEFLHDRMDRFQKYRKILSDRRSDVQTDLDICENDYSVALINNGLNPADTKAQGEWVQGKAGYSVWQAKKKETRDPEEIARRKGERQAKEDASKSSTSN